jgi:hypothetical protein
MILLCGKALCMKKKAGIRYGVHVAIYDGENNVLLRRS